MDLKKRGFQLPEKIRFEDETLTETYGKLIAEPLERGYGTTMGNVLRRVLLSSIEGAAATAVRLRGANHEFTAIDGVKEDVVDIVLNVKQLKFAMEGASGGGKTAVVKATGPREITGGDLQVDSSVRVLNPEQVIATLDKKAELDMEIYVGRGKGYIAADQQDMTEKSVDLIPVDSVFSPIQKVNFRVEKARVGRSADYDRLILEIWTDGSINPSNALSQAATIVMEHMNFFVFEPPEDLEEGYDYSPARPGEEAIFNDNLLKGVDELELSVRAHNCLKNAGIKNIADLVRKTEYEMLRTKNFGRKSLNEIKEILGTMGLHFGMRIDEEALRKKRGE